VRHGRTRGTLALITAATALLASGCGGSGASTGAAAVTTTPPATSTTKAATTPAPAATSVVTKTTTVTASAPKVPPGYSQPVTPVSGGQQAITAGPIAVTLTVTGVSNPLKTQVDSAQRGNKLVGVFVKGYVRGKTDPADVAAASLTAGGRQYPVRIIADGDCSTAFVPNVILSARKPTAGCIAFEIPQSATPQQLTVGVVAVQPKGQKGAGIEGKGSATWRLPST